MARSIIWVYLIFVAVAFCKSTYQLARRVEQSIVDRSTYLGGWPLAAVPCPPEASVICSTGVGDQINQQCCPTGNTCFSWPATIPPVCCPSAENCVGQLQNLPVCANSSWNMYEVGPPLGQNSYFCCEQGQVGVMPTTGYAGICQAQGQAVPSSLLATLVSQLGAATATASNGVPTGASTSGVDSTLTSSGMVTTTSKGTPSESSSPSGSSPSSSFSSDKNTTNGTHLATGAIAGIAVGGAIVIAALILVRWKYCSRRPGPAAHQVSTYDTVAESSFPPGRPPMDEYKASPIVSAQQVYQQRPGVNEVSGENGHFRRAEMET